MAGAGDGARSWFSACAGGCPWCFTGQLLPPGAADYRVEEGETLAWVPRAGAGGVAGTSSVFLRGGRKHLWGGVDKGQGHSQTLLVGHHAHLGEVGTKVPAKETPMRAPDQGKGVGRTHEPVLRKSPVIRGKATGWGPARGGLHGKEREQMTALHNSTAATLSKTRWAQRRPAGRP